GIYDRRGKDRRSGLHRASKHRRALLPLRWGILRWWGEPAAPITALPPAARVRTSAVQCGRTGVAARVAPGALSLAPAVGVAGAPARISRVGEQADMGRHLPAADLSAARHPTAHAIRVDHAGHVTAGASAVARPAAAGASYVPATGEIAYAANLVGGQLR